MEYAERLHVPLRWWVQGTMLVASFWLAVVVALPGGVAWILTGAAMVLLAWAFLAYGSARIVVAGGELRAGRAHIPTSLLGAATALDADQTRRLAGPEADVSAYLLLRPYLKRAVRVEVVDPADRTPYWLLHTRHPEQLVSVLSASTTVAGPSREPSA